VALSAVLNPAITEDVIDIEVAIPELIELAADVLASWGDITENTIEYTSVA
jgi:hypothetical protein